MNKNVIDMLFQKIVKKKRKSFGAAVWEAPVWKQPPQIKDALPMPHTAVSATLLATIWETPVKMLLGLESLVCAKINLSHWFAERQPRELRVCAFFSFENGSVENDYDDVIDRDDDLLEAKIEEPEHVKRSGRACR
jgi:hypothetical protein